jgi:hypothetical protein
VRRRNLGAIVAGLVVIGGLAAATIGSTSPHAPSGSFDPGASLAAIDVDPAACPLGPAEAPEPSASRAAFDDAGSILLVESTAGQDPDEGTGRVRLCVDGAEPLDLAGGCGWSVDRSAVNRIGGSVERPASGPAFVALDLAPGGVSDLVVGLSPAPEPVGQYRAIGPARVGVDTASGASAGLVRFADLPFQVNAAPVALPADQPPSISGSVRWSCGPAPAPVPGLAVGRMSIRLDQPVGKQVDVAATCHWKAGRAQAAVTAIEMAAPPVRADGGRAWSLLIDRLGDPPLATDPAVSIYLSTPNGGDSYAAAGFGDVIPVEIAPQARRGRLRFRDLSLSADNRLATLDGTEGTRTLAGTVTWSCDEPLAGPEPVPVGVPPIVPPTTRPGNATLTIGDVIADPLDVAISCRIHDDLAGGGIQVDAADGTFALGDETVRMLVGSGSFVLFRTGADGQVLGEYSTDEGEGPALVGAGEPPSSQMMTLHFRPFDPAYTPFGGPQGPRDPTASVSVDCRDPNAQPSRPDQAIGEIHLRLDGIDGADWSGRAICTWDLSAGRKSVVAVTTDPTFPIPAGNQRLMVVGLPQPQLTVGSTGGAVTYFVGNDSHVTVGELADDHASGRTTFTNLIHARLVDGHLRLGGLDGPDAISGTVDWSCGPPAGGI